jgi:hypothetical protein
MSFISAAPWPDDVARAWRSDRGWHARDAEPLVPMSGRTGGSATKAAAPASLTVS